MSSITSKQAHGISGPKFSHGYRKMAQIYYEYEKGKFRVIAMFSYKGKKFPLFYESNLFTGESREITADHYSRLVCDHLDCL